MKHIKWGFIGCGEVTEKKSGPAFSIVDGSEVVAVMSRSRDKAKAYALKHNIPRWYDDAQQLVNDDDVNAVYIATPPSSHATFAIMAMKAGKPVYVEKPLAANYEDCVRINRISSMTGMPCFVAYYRRYLPYFRKVKDIIDGGVIGKVLNVQIRFSKPPGDFDTASDGVLPWRLQSHISGGGLFYDLAPHQLDLLQHLLGVITRAHGYCANRGGLYTVADTVSASFEFEGGLPGSGSWCFVSHESARDDRIELIGDKGMLTFSVYSYDPIKVYTSDGVTKLSVDNPPYVQLPIIKSVIEHLQGIGVCTCTSISATPVNWVMDRILGKF
ncbi:MAG: Gfo/Idh/MocA family oxidoreductase [Prevotella sp.]|nr:Gfo/Idh/MocA family oxidoreductase [Prevotella sp.]MCR5151955.1 Gfo/Idh/MocA family oxidoreductase [Prevotella sp.]